MRIQQNDQVRLAYTGRFEDRTVFITSDATVADEHDLTGDSFEPLTFTVGHGEVIEGLDTAVRGMEQGETATVTVPPESAYGEHEADRVREYDPDTFEGMVGHEPEVGMHVEAQNDRHGDVTAVSEGVVEVDFNHELAGKTLVFDITVLAVS